MVSGSLGLLNRYAGSLVVKWLHIRNQPDDEDLYQYYSYYVEYKEKGSSDWIRESIVPYNPDDDPPQATIDGLTSHTEYQVMILGVRSKGGQTDEEKADKTDTKTFTTLFGTFYPVTGFSPQPIFDGCLLSSSCASVRPFICPPLVAL